MLIKNRTATLALYFSLSLTACSGSSEKSGELPAIFGPTVSPGAGITPEANAATLFNGFFKWDLGDLNVESEQAPVINNFDSQLLVRASTSDQNLVCTARTEFISRDIGLETAFTQYTANSGLIPNFSFISTDEFQAQNGPAKEFLSFRIQDDDIEVNTIGHFYYLPASQLTYGLTTTYVIKCLSKANLYALQEDRMRQILGNIEFTRGN